MAALALFENPDLIQPVFQALAHRREWPEDGVVWGITTTPHGVRLLEYTTPEEVAEFTARLPSEIGDKLSALRRQNEPHQGYLIGLVGASQEFGGMFILTVNLQAIGFLPALQHPIPARLYDYDGYATHAEALTEYREVSRRTPPNARLQILVRLRGHGIRTIYAFDLLTHLATLGSRSLEIEGKPAKADPTVISILQQKCQQYCWCLFAISGGPVVLWPLAAPDHWSFGKN